MRFHRRRRSCILALILLLSVFVATVISFRCFTSYSSSYFQLPGSALKDTASAQAVRSGSPPRVDRSILDKLRSLDADECLTEAFTRTSLPPKVTRLPVETSERILLSNSLHDPVLDNELCNTIPCRLLLPTFIGEQESKARRHLLQLSHLAQTLNRTLILPNVGRSRMSSCSKWDFGFYYELAEFHNAQAVSFGAFRRWVALRGARPTAQVIEILPARWNSVDIGGIFTFNASDLPDLEKAEVAISVSHDPAKMSHNHCLRGRANNLHFGDFSPMYIYPYTSASARYTSGRDDFFSFGQGIIAALSSPVVAMKSRRFNDSKPREPDVLLFNWEIRYPVFPPAPDEGLPYAARWMTVADSLFARLQPFIAVHWRMEQVPIPSLLSCVPLLVSTITSLLAERTEITSVYLATDYPTESSDKPHSSTFHVSQGHHKVMRIFKTAIMEAPELHGVPLTNLVNELRVGGLVPKGFGVDDLDAGLMGIIDKVVSARATLFISGGPTCGKTSSFTEQIVDERKRARASHLGLLNIVKYFG